MQHTSQLMMSSDIAAVKVLYLTCCFISIVYFANSNIHGCYNVTKDRRFKGFRYNTIKDISFSRCSTECFLRSECLSVSYNTNNMHCKLHSSDDLAFPERILADNVSIYMGMYAWKMTDALGECASRPCPVRTRCTPLRNQNYTCVITECDMGVKIPHLSGSWSFRNVGRTKSLSCSSDYYLNGSQITSTCLPTGTWSYTDSIEAECLQNP